MRLLSIAALLVFMMAVHGFIGAPGVLMPSAILCFGLLIFMGYLAGCYCAKVGLPHITGYLFAGILCGPYVLGFVNHEVVLRLELVDNIALAFIAFTAGGEIRLAKFKQLAWSILSIAAFQALAVFIIVAGGIFLLLGLVDPLGLPVLIRAAAAVLFGIIAQANSPATAVAVIVESRAKGRMSDVVIGVTVLKDVMVMFFFSVALALAFSFSRTGAGGAPSVGLAFVGIASSLVAGALGGGIIAVFLRWVRRELVIFMVTVSFMIVYLSELAGLHFILVCITAGFVVENFSSVGHRLVEAIERTSMAVYIVFFALAGAAINMSALEQMWTLALLLVALRAAGTAAGTYWGARLGGEGSLVRRHGWSGFLCQAGISLGMAGIVARAFPEWGPTFRTAVISAIAINQIIGPIALKILLGHAGETAESHIIKGLRVSFRLRRG